MIYIIVTVLIVLALVLWLRSRAKRQLVQSLQHAGNLVKVGLYTRLLAQYEESYERKFASFLAAAVTNEVFSDNPSNEEAKAFLKSNKVLIDRELRKLSSDRPLCHILTQTIRAMSAIPFANGNHGVETLYDPLAKLERLGILESGGEFPTLQTFFALATQFYETRNAIKKV